MCVQCIRHLYDTLQTKFPLSDAVINEVRRGSARHSSTIACLLINSVKLPAVVDSLLRGPHWISTGLPLWTSYHPALCFSSSVIFLLVDACVGLNWLLVSFLSHVNKNIIHSNGVIHQI